MRNGHGVAIIRAVQTAMRASAGNPARTAVSTFSTSASVTCITRPIRPSSDDATNYLAGIRDFAWVPHMRAEASAPDLYGRMRQRSPIPAGNDKHTQQ